MAITITASMKPAEVAEHLTAPEVTLRDAFHALQAYERCAGRAYAHMALDLAERELAPAGQHHAG